MAIMRRILMCVFAAAMAVATCPGVYAAPGRNLSAPGVAAAPPEAFPVIDRMRQVIQSFVASKKFMGAVLVARKPLRASGGAAARARESKT
jgi:hypothetical protein